MRSYKKFLENYIPCKEFLVCPENKKQRHIINPFPALTKRLIQNQLERYRIQNNRKGRKTMLTGNKGKISDVKSRF